VLEERERRVSAEMSEIERRMTLNTQRELRSKKMDFNSKISDLSSIEESKIIANILLKHEDMYHTVNDHFKKELLIQEDEFNKKMSKRMERTINKTINKSVDKKPPGRFLKKNKLAIFRSDSSLGESLLDEKKALRSPDSWLNA